LADAVSMRWVKDARGYDLKSVTEQGSPGSILRPETYTAVVARGEPVHYEVDNEALWDLVDTLRHADDVLEFVGKWGLLSNKGPRESMSSIWNHMKHIQQAAKLAEEKEWARLERIVGQQIKVGREGDDEARGVRLNLRYARVPGRAEPRLFLEPVNLISYCWIELMQRAAGARLLRCLKCGRLFPADEGEGARPTSRKYCSSKCRLAAHRHGL
jgi:hypothetical protein